MDNKYESLKIIRKFITQSYLYLSTEGKQYISLKYVQRLKKEKLINLYIEIEKIRYIEKYIKCDFIDTNIGTILDDFKGYCPNYQPDLTNILKE